MADVPPVVDVGVGVGVVTNDPFVDRVSIGAMCAVAPASELVAVQLAARAWPDFRRHDWIDDTIEIANENRVSPDISRSVWAIDAALRFAPLGVETEHYSGRIALFG